MAKGNRGGRQAGRSGGRAHQKGGGRKKDRVRTAAPMEQEMPTAAPGSHGLPSSIMGGGISVDMSRGAGGAIRRPELRRRNRGGPRPESERAGRAKVVYDFRYVRADLRWIALTSVVSVATVTLAWVVLRA